MTANSSKPRRVVSARRMLALGTSAAVLGAAAGAAPVTPSWPQPQDTLHRVEAEGEGDSLMIEAEGEGDAAAESEGEGDAASAAESEGEGGEGGSASATQGGELLEIDGLLRAAKALRDAGETGGDALIEEAADTAEHGLQGALAEELYEAIEELEEGEGTSGFDAVQARIAQAQAEADATARLDALPVVLRTAAGKYAEAVKDGAVADRVEYLEAFGLYGAVRAEAQALAGSDDASVAGVAAEMLAQLDETAAAFDGPSGAAIASPDASLLYGAAARMEISALKLR